MNEVSNPMAPDAVAPESDIAGIIAPPPRLYLGTLLLALGLDRVWPLPLALPVLPLLTGGLTLFALSAMFARWAFVTLRRLETSADPRQASQALAMAGPFAYSRNPIYVAMTGLYLGLALVFNSAWPLGLLLPLLLVMDHGVIRREERYLARRFGAAYEAYRQQVRRWL